MNSKSIKSHLKPYSIYDKRNTTINHAFASAIAPSSQYDEEYIKSAMICLGQGELDNLVCVYCGDDAETWDHVVGLVKAGKLRGYGHQIGNLVPCCKKCNSKKKNEDYKSFVKTDARIKADRNELIALLEKYQNLFAVPIEVLGSENILSDDMKKYLEIKLEILELMKQADEIAKRLRPITIHG